MLRSVLIVGLCLVTPAFVPGQVHTTPAVEVFGGFSYLNIRTYNREHFFNAGTGIAVNINKHLALVADVNLPLSGPNDRFGFATFGSPVRGFLPGRSGPRSLLPVGGPQTQFTVNEKTRVSTALVGPRFSLRREKMTLFAHALGGFVRTKDTIEYGTSLGGRSSFHYTTNGPAVGGGGGIDLEIGGRYSVRMVQADYLRAKLFGWSNQLRLQTGVVIRFGKAGNN
jgi:hypothetical protein